MVRANTKKLAEACLVSLSFFMQYRVCLPIALYSQGGAVRDLNGITTSKLNVVIWSGSGIGISLFSKGV